MSVIESTFSSLFAKNRAEEMPDDVWGKYVLPLKYDEVKLTKWNKASVVVGGRGSGKTMFLKYHCHPTTFSKKKNTISNEVLKMMGLYWRPDTSFTQLMNEKWLGKNWQAVFITFTTLSILIEFARLANSIVDSNLKEPKLKQEIKKYILPSPIKDKLICEKDNITLLDCEDKLQEALFYLCSWINMPLEETPPINLDLKMTLTLLTTGLKKCSSLLSDSIYHIYIDEFENLTNEQQKIINTWMKHGIPPLLFSTAYKKNAEVTYETIGNEKIVPRNDYRTLDLEDVFSQDFDLLAAEVLALRLAEKNDLEVSDYIKFYSDEDTLTIRKKNVEYIRAIKELANNFLPEKKHNEIALEIITDPVLLRKAELLITEGLKLHNETNLKKELFIDLSFPEASVVNGVLLNRKNNKPSDILKEFDKYKKSDSSKYKNWISNNLVGTILYIYGRASTKFCPLYAGFRQFTLMSRGNLRHFLELCHQSMIKAEFEQSVVEKSGIFALPVDTQAKATYQTSAFELEKISDLGANGVHLKRVARRLGIIYSLSQKRKTQSEPEINHFTLDLSDTTQLTERTQKLLNEALVWSVLFEEESTKIKSDDTTETKDYLLHPVLSAFFKISYRKKRKLKLKPTEVEVIFFGEESEFIRLIKNFKYNWGLDEYNEGDVSDEEFIKGEQLGLL
ncbi:hypothetical protein NB703_004290 [Pantoea ananatis]|uniref:Uncharacterized protein n=1 Tax=Pantoea ananas TaxID=553 RepID=A0AAJ1FRT3_PANAN|nr:hypothetical protein [Pantoea ananatis]MCW0346197.1 hypothetical protein [Pantoea ananatis]